MSCEMEKRIIWALIIPPAIGLEAPSTYSGAIRLIATNAAQALYTAARSARVRLRRNATRSGAFFTSTIFEKFTYDTKE